jgi:hypothetical protein
VRRPLVAVAAAFLVLLAGCAETTQGSPSPGGSAPADPTTAETTEETTTSEQPAGLADVDPCELLDATDLAALQLTGGEGKTVGSARVCRWQRDGATLNETFTVSAEVFDNQGLGALNTPDVQELPAIGGHDAAKFTDATGTCGVSLGVGDSSRVDNTAVGGDQQLGCQIAEQLATIVERKLP